MTACVPPRPPRIVFTSSRAWYSAVIRWLTRSPASHVMLQFDVFGQELFLHASVGGIQFTPRAKFLRDNYIVREYEILSQVPRERVVEMIAHLNEKYDYVGLVGFGMALAVQALTGKRVTNRLASSNAMVCSEFVAHLDPGGEAIEAFRGLEPEATTPEALRQLCVAASVKGQLKEL